MNKKILWITGLVLIAAFGYYTYQKSTKIPEINLSEMPLENLSGIPLNLGYRSNKPFIVFFWETENDLSRKEFPIFNKAYNKYADRVNFVMISDEDPEKITTFKSLGMYSFIFARATKPLGDFDINSVPLTYFYNAEGKQVFQKLGAWSEKELENEIQKILSETH